MPHPQHFSLSVDGKRVDYRLHADEATLTQLGPAILTHLGCSYEIKWPARTDADRERRAQERLARARRLTEDAENYAALHLPFWAKDDEGEAIKDLLISAYRAGHAAAPKGPNS